MITSVDHIHIHAADPMATIWFYESCLGAEHLGSIPSGEGGRNHGVVIELVELHLPAPLARFVPVLNGVNRAIHLTRRAPAKQLFK